MSTLTKNAQPLTPAAAPTGAGRIGVVGPSLAALTLAAAVVLGREALLAWDTVSGSSWLKPAATWLENVRQTDTIVLVIGIVLVILGLWLLASAFSRRSRRTLHLKGAGPGTTTTTRDLARLATRTTSNTDGVIKANSTATRRTLEVNVHGTSSDIRPRLEQELNALADSFEPRPAVKLHVQVPHSSRKAGDQ